MTRLKDLLPMSLYELEAMTFGVGQPYVDQRMIDEPPPAKSGLITIPQALAVVGKSIDGENWKDWERSAKCYPPFQEPKETVASILERIEQADPRPRLPARSVPLHDSRGSRHFDYERERNEREAAQERIDAWDAAASQRMEAARAEFERDQALSKEWAAGVADHQEGVTALRRAFNELTKAIGDNKVTPWTLCKATGKLDKASADDIRASINTESLIRKSSIHEVWNGSLTNVAVIFYVDEAELRLAFPCSQPAPTQVGGLEMECLSPYLRLAIRLARDHEITADHHSKIDSLRADIEDLCNEYGLEYGAGQTMNPHLRNALATMIRWPAGRKGGNTRVQPRKQ